MKTKSLPALILLSISIFFGLFLLGFFIFKGLKTFSDKDRVVTVKGLAEINMTATAASISIYYTISGDDLNDVLKQNKSKKLAISGYLGNLGITENEVIWNNIDVIDREVYYRTEWKDGVEVQVKLDRFSVNQSASLKVKDVVAAESKAAQLKLGLISNNLTSSIRANYTFAELNSIKPKLIAESTKNARVAGEQFANDSQAALGKIKTASQGQITIVNSYYYDEDSSSRAPSEPYIQKARVVSTIVFFLE